MAAYYDFMLIGRSGAGKTTLGNKLLQRKPETIQFVLDAKAQVRVLDVPGFSAAGPESGLKILCEVTKEHKQDNLQVQRVVYFLPNRGPLEKADGSLQEELQVMHRFFGPDVFDCMVVIATNSRSHQQMGFDEEVQKQTEESFHLALKRAIGDEKIGCPPIVYIAIDESEVEVMDKLKMAKVLQEKVLELSQDFYNDAECSRCDTTIRYNRRKVNLGVVDTASGALTAYDESKCHPTHSVPKYTTCEKVLGTIFHIITFGIILLIRGTEGVWPPTLINSDEVCPVCKLNPKSPGCREVNKDIDCDWKEDHDSTKVRLYHHHMH